MADFRTQQAALLARWQEAWPQALEVWSKYTRLHDPHLCQTRIEAAKEGLTGSFAMIRLVDKSVVVDLEAVMNLGLSDYGVEVLAHEIGHHVLAPASATDHYRLLARMRAGLPTLEQHAAMIANLFTDLLINDRLQRRAQLRMADVYRAIQAEQKPSGTQSRLWLVYMGIYEALWQLEKGSLGGPVANLPLEGDAFLGARLIRVYADDWMIGAGRFAALMLPHLVADAEQSQIATLFADTRAAAIGAEPQGLSDIGHDEVGGAIHPSADPLITGSGLTDESHTSEIGNHPGQARQPFEYGQIIRAAGSDLTDHDIAVRYYREQAQRHLIAFPTRQMSRSKEPQLEGIERWEIGESFDEIDWLQTISASPKPIPGVTITKRAYGEEQGSERARNPVDLDIYVDSSGSMPNPQTHISYLALAGAIIGLSALRAGARVQVTLWSGVNQFISTKGFVRDSDAILRVLTGFFGGGTAFPIHKLRDTYAGHKPHDRNAHILMISDDGLSTMFDTDERGNDGWDVSAKALERAGGGGTMALNLPAYVHQYTDLSWLKRAQEEQKWAVHTVSNMKDLTDFARAFSQRQYGD
jgi:hypothetical protein